MIPILFAPLLAFAAHAADPCVTLSALLERGVPTDIVAQVMRDGGVTLTADQARCLVKAGASESMLEAGKAPPVPPTTRVRLEGFGWSVHVNAPFRATHPAEHAADLHLAHRGPAGLHTARVDLSTASPTTLLGEDTDSLEDVAQLAAGSPDPKWTFASTHLRMPWPDGWVLAHEPGDTLVELHGPDGSLIFVRGPYPASTLVPLEQMVAEGQRVRRSSTVAGHASVELRYTREGVQWAQQHVRVDWTNGDSLVITTQCPSTARKVAFKATAALIPTLSAP